MTARRSYPLQWPKTARRTEATLRERSKFGDRQSGNVSVYAAAKKVLRELGLLGAGNVVITSMLPTRNDGLPYADGGRQQLDPGMAVWFDFEGAEMVFACDRWASPGENLRAIELSINAMRGLERWGMADVVARAFAGFKSLPPGASGTMPSASRPWREVLGGVWPELDASELLVLAKARHRSAIKAAHPDAGGDAAAAAEINAALDQAERELAGAGQEAHA